MASVYSSALFAKGLDESCRMWAKIKTKHPRRVLIVLFFCIHILLLTEAVYSSALFAKVLDESCRMWAKIKTKHPRRVLIVLFFCIHILLLTEATITPPLNHSIHTTNHHTLYKFPITPSLRTTNSFLV